MSLLRPPALTGSHHQATPLTQRCGYPRPRHVHQVLEPDLLYLGVRNISGRRPGNRGNTAAHWTAALNVFEIYFPGRINLG